MLDQMEDAADQRAGFARTRPGRDGYGTVFRADCFPLRLV